MGNCIGSSHISNQVDATNTRDAHGVSDADRLGTSLGTFEAAIGLTPEQQTFMDNGAPTHVHARFSRLHQATQILLTQTRTHHHYFVNGGAHPGTNPGQLVTQMQNQTREWAQMREEVARAMSNPQRPAVVVVNPAETVGRNVSRRIGFQTF